MAAPLGNQNSSKGRSWANAIRRAIARKAAGCLDHGLDALADLLVAAAEKGDQWAMLEIGNRLDGKAAQAIQFQDEDGLALGMTVMFHDSERLPAGGIPTETPLPLSS